MPLMSVARLMGALALLTANVAIVFAVPMPIVMDIMFLPALQDIAEPVLPPTTAMIAIALIIRVTVVGIVTPVTTTVQVVLNIYTLIFLVPNAILDAGDSRIVTEYRGEPVVVVQERGG